MSFEFHSPLPATPSAPFTKGTRSETQDVIATWTQAPEIEGWGRRQMDHTDDKYRKNAESAPMLTGQVLLLELKEGCLMGVTSRHTHTSPQSAGPVGETGYAPPPPCPTSLMQACPQLLSHLCNALPLLLTKGFPQGLLPPSPSLP